MDRVSYDFTGQRRGGPKPPTDAAGLPLGTVSSSAPSDGELRPDAAALQQALSEVTHDLNNPLAIISGNAQLLLELARMLDLEPDLAKPIQDIEEASHRLSAMVRRLNELKEGLAEDPPRQ